MSGPSSLNRLARSAFRPAPDPRSEFETESHRTIRLNLDRAIDSSAGLAVLTGAAGLGKTHFGLKFLENWPAESQRLLLNCPPSTTPIEFYQAILFDLGRPYVGSTLQELRLAIQSEMLDALEAGQSVAILIDEAHHLSTDVFEELRWLTNLETKDRKAVFILLLGLPRLRETLHRPEFAPFRQRLAFDSVLEPLSREDSVEYLRHRIHAAGERPDWVATTEALDLIAERGEGTPRVLNRLAAFAFDIASQAGSDQLDAEAVLETFEQLDFAMFPAERMKVHPAPLPITIESNDSAGPKLRPRGAKGIGAERATPTKKTKRKSA